MKKRAQEGDEDISFFSPGLRGKTLFDLYREIQADPTLQFYERRRIEEALARATRNAPASTPLSAFAFIGGGGLIGYLISKYFGMGIVGRALSTLVGAGVGRQLKATLEQPPRTHRGWVD
jgi:hypothetical protein